MNLYQKLVEIRKNIGGFTKDTKGYNYSYVSGTQVLSKIQETMNELGVLLIPKVLDQNHEKHEYVSSKGKPALDFIVHGNMVYTWVNAENPEEKLEVPFYYTGSQDDISKAFGSGLTYSERYFIIKFFNLPTDADDPDARDTSGRSGKENYKNNFQNKEENKTPQNPKEAGDTVITFGKHNGKTLRQLWTEDYQYLMWLLENGKQQHIKDAIGIMQVAVAQQQAQEKMQQ